MKASQQTEIEKKYDVAEDAAVPDLANLPGVARVGKPHTSLLTAVYFDTDRHALASRRITLRRRTGGMDAGWHVKLPPEPAEAGAGHEQRRELHAPLGQPDVVPDSLLAHVQAYVRGADLTPVAKLRTSRTTYALYGADGSHLADLADDRVEAVRLHAGVEDEKTRQRWREWELELVQGDPELFEPAAQLLAEAGARPAGHASKLARALRGASKEEAAEAGKAPAGKKAGSAPGLGRKAPAAAVAVSYLQEQLRRFLLEDAAVRLEEPEAIHDMRSVTRRLRSVLAAYRHLFLAAPVQDLRDELRWLNRLLGEPRDAEVVRSRLLEHLGGLPRGDGAEAVRDLVEDKAGSTYNAGYRLLQEALLSARYFKLLEDLEGFCRQPPVRPGGATAGRKVAAAAVDKAARQLRRAHKAAVSTGPGADRVNALHEVRKKAKQLRHVAESAAPVRGKRAMKVAKAAHRQQKHLGDYHDAVLARCLLQDLEGAGNLPEPAATALAVLRKRQEQLMDRAEVKYRKARKKSRKLLPKRGVL